MAGSTNHANQPTHTPSRRSLERSSTSLQFRKTAGVLRCTNRPRMELSNGSPRTAATIAISRNQRKITRSRVEDKAASRGNTASSMDGRLTNTTPNPLTATIDNQSVPGGRGSSGCVQPTLGRAKNSRNRHGPNAKRRYVEPDCAPPRWLSSMASTRSLAAMPGVLDADTRPVRSTMSTASASPVGRLEANSPVASSSTGHVNPKRSAYASASEGSASSPITTISRATSPSHAPTAVSNSRTWSAAFSEPGSNTLTSITSASPSTSVGARIDSLEDTMDGSPIRMLSCTTASAPRLS